MDKYFNVNMDFSYHDAVFTDGRDGRVVKVVPPLVVLILGIGSV